MNGFEVNYPCSPVCALFGDCVTAFEKQKKARVRTNADRIRAMSDEELAVFLRTVEYDVEQFPFVQDWDKWLQQPAEGE
jgi:hypothetical protein